MSLALSVEELVELTGYVRPSKQIEWLEGNAVPHFVNALGRPVVIRAMLEGRAQSAIALGDVR